MPNPTQREEREKIEKAEKKPAPAPAPAPKENPFSVEGVAKSIADRKKLLDET